MTKDYIAVDLEMTGLNPKTDRILEIGAVKVQDGQIRETFSRLINPGRSLDSQIVALTGITDEMASQGEETDASVEAFLEFAGDLTWIGHNVQFDYKYIRQWEVNHRINKQHYAVDTLKIARRCLPDLEKKSLDYLCDYFGIKRDVRHRALDDAKANRLLYEILKERFYKEKPELFLQKELQYKVKRQTPITPRQTEYLKKLMQHYGLVPDIPIEQLSRSDASRLTDKIILQYGKLSV